MKTTKKRLVLSIAGAALLCVGAVFTTLAATAEPQITDETMLANIEALSQSETGIYYGGCSLVSSNLCSKSCSSCGAVHYPNGYAKGVSIIYWGKCDRCGALN